MMPALNHESIGQRERRKYGRTYKADTIASKQLIWIFSTVFYITPQYQIL